MNDEHVLKGAFEGIKFGPGIYSEFPDAPTVYSTMTCVHVRDLVPVSKEKVHVSTHAYYHY